VKTYSKESYRSLLLLALDHGYKLIDFLDERGKYERCIYLRHDVDMSLDLAVELAKINASVGVRGTFFVLLRSNVYNLLSHSSLERIDALRALNQHIGLHYALPPKLPEDDEQLGDLIRADFEVVQRHIPDLQAVFSWHNPTPEALDRGLHWQVRGLINTYSASYFKDIPYYSDSLMRNSVEKFQALISSDNHQTLQLLFHPVYWIVGGSNTFEVLAKTWPQIIREREYEMKFNSEWVKHAPDGVPTDVLDSFVHGLLGSLRMTNH
jgi:hypothetical protein